MVVRKRTPVAFPSAKTQQLETLLKISQLKDQFPREETHANKTDKEKVKRLLLADGVGAAIAAPTGPWGLLWGGFLTTLSLEPYLRSERPTISLPDSETGSGEFVYGIMGDYHNSLMVDAIDENLYATIESNHINSSTVNFLLNYTYTNMPPIEDLEATFADNEGVFIAGINNTVENRDSISDMINDASNITNNVKAIIYMVAEDFDDIDDENFTEYLLEIQDIVSQSTELTESEIQSTLAFLAIANSNFHLWSNN